jgi:Electron transfer DM13
MKTVRTTVYVTIIALLLGVTALAAFEYLYSPSLVLTGSFHPVAHKGSGSAFLYQYRNGKRLLSLKDLSTAARPDLAVFLIDAPDAFDNDTVKNSRVLSLGPLKGLAQDQVYDVAAGVDLTQYHAVIIWSQKYAVNFTTAPLR